MRRDVAVVLAPAVCVAADLGEAGIVDRAEPGESRIRVEEALEEGFDREAMRYENVERAFNREITIVQVVEKLAHARRDHAHRFALRRAVIHVGEIELASLVWVAVDGVAMQSVPFSASDLAQTCVENDVCCAKRGSDDLRRAHRAWIVRAEHGGELRAIRLLRKEAGEGVRLSDPFFAERALPSADRVADIGEGLCVADHHDGGGASQCSMAHDQPRLDERTTAMFPKKRVSVNKNQRRRGFGLPVCPWIARVPLDVRIPFLARFTEQPTWRDTQEAEGAGLLNL